MEFPSIRINAGALHMGMRVVQYYYVADECIHIVREYDESHIEVYTDSVHPRIDIRCQVNTTVPSACEQALYVLQFTHGEVVLETIFTPVLLPREVDAVPMRDPNDADSVCLLRYAADNGSIIVALLVQVMPTRIREVLFSISLECFSEMHMQYQAKAAMLGRRVCKWMVLDAADNSADVAVDVHDAGTDDAWVDSVMCV